MKTMVIAVSGYSGAGKSTVVSLLSRAFNCSALFFDDYLIQYLRNDSEVLINLLDHFLFDYLNRGVKDMYSEIGKKVKANSDLVINANRNVEEIVLEISELIRKK